VLVVEDDKPIGDIVVDAINDEAGYTAVRVGNAADAMAALSTVPADLIVLDIRLPGMSGIELYDRIRSDERLPEGPGDLRDRDDARAPSGAAGSRYRDVREEAIRPQRPGALREAPRPAPAADRDGRAAWVDPLARRARSAGPRPSAAAVIDPANGRRGGWP